MSPRPFISIPFAERLDWIVAIVCTLIGAGFCYYVNSLNLTLALVDQFSHWSIAHTITHSITPGVSQIGFWQPLLHVMLAPVTAISSWYASGVSVALVMVPIYVIGVVLLLRILLALSGSTIMSLAGIAAYALNPYVLYFAVTAMSETLFLTLMFFVAWCLLYWWETQTVHGAVLFGIAITLASLARFEGLILIPLAAGIMLVRMVRRGFPFSRIEGMLTLFLLTASLGAAFIFIYGAVYGDDPLAFMRSRWAAAAQQAELVLPAHGNVSVAVAQLGVAADRMVGTVAVVVGLISFIAAVVWGKGRRLLLLSVGGILLAPALFVILALYQGSAVIYVPEFAPHYERYFNTRYALSLIAISVVGITTLSGMIIALSRRIPILGPITLWSSAFLMAILLNSTLLLLISEACPGPECFSQVRQEFQAADPSSLAAAQAIGKQYEGGAIFMTRALHAEMSVKTGIPLSNFILESNHPYYLQALSAPWMFARYVVMANPEGFAANGWYLDNELILAHWGEAAGMSAYYTLMIENPKVRVFKLNEEAVRELAKSKGLLPADVPSLSGRVRWDTVSDYGKIGRALSISGYEALMVTP